MVYCGLLVNQGKSGINPKNLYVVIKLSYVKNLVVLLLFFLCSCPEPVGNIL